MTTPSSASSTQPDPVPASPRPPLSPARAFRLANGVIAPVVRRGWLAPVPLGLGVVLLETTGRRSGRRRSTPVLALRAGERLLVGTVRRRSDWMANLSDDGAPSVVTRGGTVEVEADLHALDPFAAVAVLRLGDVEVS